MNDNDIIKALGFCFAVGDCEHCAYADKPCQYLMGDAFELINRQKSEIERLKRDVDEAWCEYSDLQIDKDEMFNESVALIKNAGIKAIKEFAAKLKERLRRRTEYDEGGWDVDLFTVTEEDIDDLAKEMTEGKDA